MEFVVTNLTFQSFVLLLILKSSLFQLGDVLVALVIRLTALFLVFEDECTATRGQRRVRCVIGFVGEIIPLNSLHFSVLSVDEVRIPLFDLLDLGCVSQDLLLFLESRLKSASLIVALSEFLPKCLELTTFFLQLVL